MVKETRNVSNKMRNWIPIVRLVSDILFEIQLVKKLIDARMTKEVEFFIGKNFIGNTLKNMSLITNIVNSSELLDKAFVAYRRIPVDDYPPYLNEVSKEVMEIYIAYCLASGIDLGVLSNDELLDNPIDV